MRFSDLMFSQEELVDVLELKKMQIPRWEYIKSQVIILGLPLDLENPTDPILD